MPSTSRRSTRGRRGRKTDVEWINRRRLLRGAERLTDAQRHTLFAKLLTADPGEDIAAAWIANELLRELLSCVQRGGLRFEIHTALDRFYRFCAACKVPEVISFARTIETWQGPIIAALQTGLTNARTERYNRIVKHVGRIPTPSRTMGLHPPIPAGHTQQAPMPLLTAKSRFDGRAGAYVGRFCGRRISQPRGSVSGRDLNGLVSVLEPAGPNPRGLVAGRIAR